VAELENAKEVAPVKTAYRRNPSHFCLALILVLLTGSVSQSACVQDELAKVDGGIFVVTASGAVYRVINNNGVDLAFWLPPVGVVICDQITMSGESYYAISNQDANQTVFAVRER
jgi:hypothetical protein